jgi:hypothetical protein
MNFEDTYQNYQLLLKTKEDLDTKKPITRDWYEFHRNLILQYAEVVPTCNIHQEMDDPGYNEVADNVESILQDLKEMIEACNIFPISKYLYLVSAMIDMIDRATEMRDLNNLMQMM